jgi:hypothetical protein
MLRSVALGVMATILGLSAPALHGQNAPGGRDFSLPRAEVSLAYSATEANAGPGQCGCFFMNGASAEGNFRTWRGYTTVVDVTAAHTGEIHNTGQPFSLIMVTANASISGLDTSGTTDGIPTTTSSLSYKGWRGLPMALIPLFPTRRDSFNLPLIRWHCWWVSGSITSTGDTYPSA